MNALILVDLQNDFLPGGALAVRDGEQVIAVANRLTASAEFSMVIATQDWHPAHHASFAANHPDRNVGEVIDLEGLAQVLWPVHCVENTGGALFAPGLESRRIHRVFQKGTDASIDSYSGFFDNGHRKPTGLGEYLKAQGVTAVTVLGLATDYCVKFTALDARGLGFEVTLVREGCRAVNLAAGDEAAAIEAMRAAGVRILD